MMQSRLFIVPVELRDANTFISIHHRSHRPVVGHRFSLGAVDEGETLRGVCIVGRPVSRHTDQSRVVEVTRLCTDGCPNACSALYSAAARTAKSMGYQKIQTFILNTESGTSLIASGWTMEATSRGGNWTSKSKPNRRQDQPQCPKRKYSRILCSYRPMWTLPSSMELVKP